MYCWQDGNDYLVFEDRNGAAHLLFLSTLARLLKSGRRRRGGSHAGSVTGHSHASVGGGPLRRRGSVSSLASGATGATAATIGSRVAPSVLAGHGFALASSGMAPGVPIAAIGRGSSHGGVARHPYSHGRGARRPRASRAQGSRIPSAPRPGRVSRSPTSVDDGESASAGRPWGVASVGSRTSAHGAVSTPHHGGAGSGGGGGGRSVGAGSDTGATLDLAQAAAAAAAASSSSVVHPVGSPTLSSAGSVGAVSSADRPAQGADRRTPGDARPESSELGPLKLAFVACCHSHRVGELFLSAGAHYAVCVRRQDKVMDTAGAIFARAFYHALLTGQTISEAFEVGQARVATEADLPPSESDKFELLVNPALAGEDEATAEEPRLFAETLAGPFVDMVTRCRFTKLPAATEHFVGRQQSMCVCYMWLGGKQWLGCGCSCMCVCACMHVI